MQLDNEKEKELANLKHLKGGDYVRKLSKTLVWDDSGIMKELIIEENDLKPITLNLEYTIGFCFFNLGVKAALEAVATPGFSLCMKELWSFLLFRVKFG